ncbi:S9 family peptidase [Lysobacter sp. CFH 32150]|uniref:S9 family peptidase n=1 Tax=Lysobacter sp. CFH 32150 TaxID=2927128 RepID=UPI001FA733F3|nr:S9 family peptidase [Lysobacter sp. CFH 32150]MCI4569406.1 S9 family peptidase [Lysobacter sp. CFH 32150]
MRHAHRLLVAALTVACTLPVTAQTPVQREEVGNRVSENIPAIPAELIEKLNRYQNTRGAGVAGWTQDGCLLISTRFAETAQAHRVCQPLGMREQLTFYPEPVSGLTTAPTQSQRNGFVFGKDKGGDEFSQLYWFDFGSRETTLLTDGKRTQNNGALFSDDGKQLAFRSTARNGTDTDIWLMDVATKTSKPLVTEGGSWGAMDFSPDGKRLLVMKFVSANESYPGVVDLATGKLELFPVDGGKAAFGGFKFAPDGKAVYFVSDEPFDGKPREFQTLRYHNPDSGEFKLLTGDTPWDVGDLEISEDGKYLAYTTNEEGIDKLHVLSLADHKPIKLPELPIGLLGGLNFSADSRRLALTLNTATSPSDAYVIDLADAKLTRWTRSEVGGLDSSKFVAPTLVRFETFDTIDSKPRTIPAFYYRPANVPAGKKLPVIINIHGGPESQALPSFSAGTQFLVNELGVAVLVPNVRGSSGYGKTYLTLDNADKREDSVKDIGALLDWIAKQPGLDASRVGVQGGSYGGYMVLASLTHYSDSIRAGIDIVGISHFGTFLNNTESYRRDLRRVEYGDERDPAMKAVFEEISPLNNAGKIRSPLFVAQGKNDPRVPYTEAEQIVKAVRANGQPVWYLLYADEGHGFAKKSNNDYYGAASILFWQQHLLGDTK